MSARPPQPGTLNNRITIQEDLGTRSATGKHVPNWTDYVAVWASVAPVSGQESDPASQVEALVTHDVWIRYGSHVSRLTSGMRFVLDGRVCHFTAVQRHDERGFWWRCVATEAPDQAAVSVGSYWDRGYWP